MKVLAFTHFLLMLDDRREDYDIMHILFTAYEFVTEKSPCGGFGNYLANISTVLAENGHKVTILVISNHNSDFEWKKNIEIITFHYHYVMHPYHWEDYLGEILPIRNLIFFNYGLAIKNKIMQIHKKNPIDIIQYNGDRLEVLYRIREVPTVVRLSSIGEWYRHAYNPNSDMDDYSWMKTWDTKLFLHSLKKADAVYGPSHRVADFINMKSAIKVKVIESPYLARENFLEKYQVSEILKGKKYLLFFGRICILKGINTIINAINQILEENPNLYFVLAGNVEKKGSIKKLQEAAGEHRNRIIYMGDIKQKEVLYGLIKHAEACVFPSRADNLPNSCIESMGMGKIVIGTYGASFEQLIEDKKSGLLIKCDSPEELILAIRYLMKMSKEEKEEMGKLAQKRIEQMHPEKIYNQLIAFYQNVIDRHKK